MSRKFHAQLEEHSEGTASSAGFFSGTCIPLHVPGIACAEYCTTNEVCHFVFVPAARLIRLFAQACVFEEYKELPASHGNIIIGAGKCLWMRITTQTTNIFLGRFPADPICQAYAKKSVSSSSESKNLGTPGERTSCGIRTWRLAHFRTAQPTITLKGFAYSSPKNLSG